MAILEENQDAISNQIQKAFNFVNLTYAETNTNRFLLRSLQKDILQVNNTVHHLSNELKVLFHNRNFFITMFQLRSHLATVQSRMYSVKRMDILSILDKLSVISSQNLKPTLLNPSDHKLLLPKLEDQLMSHPHLALSQWEGETYGTYKFMKLQSYMLSDTLFGVLHIPLVNRSLQFKLHRIHNIPVVHPFLK